MSKQSGKSEVTITIETTLPERLYKSAFQSSEMHRNCFGRFEGRQKRHLEFTASIGESLHQKVRNFCYQKLILV